MTKKEIIEYTNELRDAMLAEAEAKDDEVKAGLERKKTHERVMIAKRSLLEIY